MKKMFVILFIAIMPIIFGCSDSSSPNPTPTVTLSDYFPTSVGSWWKNDNFDIDTTGNHIQQTDSDSGYVEGTFTIFGKNSSLFVRTIFNNLSPKDSTYFNISGSKLLVLMNLGGLLNVGSNNQWVKMLDFDSTNWDTFHFDSSMFDIDLNLTTRLVLDMSGQKISDNTVYSIKGNSYNAYIFKSIMTMKLYSVVMGINTLVSQMNMTSTVTLCKGIGEVKSVQYTTNWDVMSGYSKNGTESVLTDFHIAP